MAPSPVKLPDRVVRDFDAAQRNFEAIEGLFPLATALLGDGVVTDAKLATRIVRGDIAAAGTINFGSGFSVVKNGTGDYTVTFTTAFAAAPVVVLTLGPTGGGVAIKHNDAAGPTINNFRVQGFLTATGAASDLRFQFIAISV